MKLLLTGGGTGGHVYPAIAIAQALAGEPAARPLDVLFAGSRDRLEATIVPAGGYRIAFVSGAPFTRKKWRALPVAVLRNALGIVQSLGMLHRFRPDCVVATGGYVAFPVVVAARIVRWLRLSPMRIALLEPNARTGLTNRVLAPLADEVWLARRDAGPAMQNAIVTGTPVRASFLETIDRSQARSALGLDPGKVTIVVFGGSQGARSINEAVAALQSSGSMLESRQMLHVSGTHDVPAAAGISTVRYLEDPRTAYAAADLVVARAGASTLAEIAAAGVPAILIPYPHAAADHQWHNAQSFAAAGAAHVIADRDLSGERLMAEIEAALVPDTLDSLRRAAAAGGGSGAARTIAARIVSLCTRGSRIGVANRAHP